VHHLGVGSRYASCSSGGRRGRTIRIQGEASLFADVGRATLVMEILREWPDFQLLVGAGLSVKLPPAIHLVPPRTIAKSAARPVRAATKAKPAKLQALPYNYNAPGALTPEQRDACLDGLVDSLLDIFLTMSPEQRARYSPKE
jgi:hypothetical protein